jgi:membrane protein DedA with SNARE-associated domain
LIVGKRPIIALSTRALLVVVLGFAFGYVLSDHSLWHPILGAGTLILNVIFIGFALIDYVNWHKAKARR